MPPRHPKVSGVKIGQFKGLKIYGELKNPKRRRVGQAFESGGAPFGVWFFKGCGLSVCL
jgi:hypothetical protein